MHASLEQLIGLRDQEPVAAEVQQHVRGCGRCAQTLGGLMAARDVLTAVPDPLPPADAWSRIVATADRDARRRRRWLPAAGVGLAASITAVVLLVNLHMAPAPVSGDTTAAAADLSPNGNADVTQLMAQSRYLERAVLKLDDHADRLAVSAGTASTIAALEDRIAMVDYEINDASGKKGTGQHVAELWKQRVDLLQSLAAVRYAQVADAGI